MENQPHNRTIRMGVSSLMENEMIEMEPSGRVLPLFRGDYLDNVIYENPDIVLFNNSSYVAKKTTIGNPPPTDALSDDNWQMVAKGIIDADVSTSIVRFSENESESMENIESGEKLEVGFGKLRKALILLFGHYVNKATASILGHVKLSNSAAITKAGEYALDAIEKNAAIEGTLANLINSLNSNMNNLIIYRTWQFLTYEEEIIISPNETRYFGIEKPVVDGYRCIGVSLQEKHGGANGYLLVTYTESLMTVYNPRNTDAYFWGAIFKFVYIKC